MKKPIWTNEWVNEWNNKRVKMNQRVDQLMNSMNDSRCSELLSLACFVRRATCPSTAARRAKHARLWIGLHQLRKEIIRHVILSLNRSGPIWVTPPDASIWLPPIIVEIWIPCRDNDLHSSVLFCTLSGNWGWHWLMLRFPHELFFASPHIAPPKSPIHRRWAVSEPAETRTTWPSN